MAAAAAGSGPTAAGAAGNGARRGAVQTYDRLQYGDLVAFFVEDKGFLAAPAIDEPIPLAPSLQQPPFLDANRCDHSVDATGPSLSHLRAARPLHSGTKIPADFHNRCIWEVLSEGGVKATDEPVTYGSTIQLRHTKTGFLITVDTVGGGIQSMAVATAGGLGPPPLNPAGGSLHDQGAAATTTTRIFTRLRNGSAIAGTGAMRGPGVGGVETSASQFYLRPRYSVRAEGDLVRDQDRVIFESCRFKGLQLCLERGAAVEPTTAHTGLQQSVLPPGLGAGATGASFAAALLEEAPPPEGIVSVGDDAYLRSGWQIHLVSRERQQGVGIGRDHLLLSAANPLAMVAGRALPAAAAAGKAAAALGGEGAMGASALEDGVVICGGDFVRFAHQEIIGHLIARVDDGAERCSRISPLGMVYRKLQLERERATGVFLRRGALQPSALSIFQVIPQQVASGQPVEWDAPVRLRHLLTGQYMALRPEHPGDSASIRASAKLTHVRASAVPAAASTGGSGGGTDGSVVSSRPTTAGTESGASGNSSSGSATGAAAAEGGAGTGVSPRSPTALAAAAALDLVGSSSLDLSLGSDASGTPTLFAGASTPATGGGAAAAGAPSGSAAAAALQARVKLVMATVSDPEDPATLFRFHPVRDADTAYVTSKSKCLLVHHETGAHLSLGHSLIAQHGKMSSGLLRDRPGTGGGAGGGGLSFASVAMAAKAAAAFIKHEEEGKDGGGEAGEEDEARQAARYWEYENDSLVFASCEDNSDAEVYRIYPVKPATTRNLLYTLRFQPVIAEAVEVVRGMRLDALHPNPAPQPQHAQPAFFGTPTPSGVAAEAGDGAASSLRSSSSGPRSTTGLLRSPTLLSQRQSSSSTLRLTRGGLGNATITATLRPDELYVAACQHLLYALHELILWQGGDIDADGEIQRREGVPLFSLVGDDGSARLYNVTAAPDSKGGHAAGCGGGKKGPMFSSSSAAGGGASGSAHASGSSARGRNLMEKDEDSFDRDMTWRRRELLRNTHVVEGLLMFISVAFQLYRGRTYARTRAELLAAAARGDAAAAEVVAATEGNAGAAAAPDAHLLSPDAIPLIDACCRYAYRLLREMMTSSCALTVLYLAGVNSMVRHISLGWDPPIEEILAAAIDQDRSTAGAASSTSGSSNANSGGSSGSAGLPISPGVTGSSASMPDAGAGAPPGGWNQYRLSCSDLYQLVLELYASYMKKDITGTKILKLLANVCAPGNVVDPKVQSFLAELILHTKRKDGSSSASCAEGGAGSSFPTSFTLEELAQVPEVTSLLFSLRPGGAQGGWRVHLSLMQEKPLYTPDSREMDLFSEAERGMIKEAFNRYDEDGNGAIDQEELGLLLQDLGLQSLIVEEVQSRWTGSIGFEQFCAWWHQHRHILETWSSPFEFSASSAPAPSSGGGGSRPGTGGSEESKASGDGSSPKPRSPLPRRVDSLASPPPSSTTAAGPPGGLPPALAISNVSPNSGPGARRVSLPSPLAGSASSDKAPSPLSTMKRRAAQSTRALPPRSLTVDEEEIGEQDIFAMPDAIFRRWIDIELIFTHERFAAEARWVRASVRLLIALCRERNLVSQKLVGAIVPVDAILYLLHSNALGEADKALFCDLLRTLYVEHDLVFPVSPLLPHQAACLSLDPEQVAYGEMGRVFNPLSQATLSLAAVGSSPTDQRAGLRALLAEHLGKLEDYVGPASRQQPQQQGTGGSHQREAFATSLMRLTHALLLQGFFEPEMGRRPRGAWALTDAGASVSARSLGAHTAGLLTSFFGGRGEGDEEEERQQRASEWGPPVAMEQAVAASAAASAAAAGVVPGHVKSPKGLLSLLVSPRGRTGPGRGSPLPHGGGPQQHTLTYSFLEATLILTLEAAGRATVARAKAVNGGEGSSLQDLQVAGAGAFSAVFDEPGPISLKAEVMGLLRTLADVRSVKNAKALLSSFRATSESGGPGAAVSLLAMAPAGAHESVRQSLALGGRDSAAGGAGGGGGSKALFQLRFGRAQEAVLDRGFDDRSADGEVFINAVVGTTAHRERSLLVKAYDLLYRHSTQRVAFAALLEELDVTRRPSLAITMRTQRLALELFEKHLQGFYQRAKVSCDVLSYVLHLLTRLCYRNWDEGQTPLVSPTATANGLPGGAGGVSFFGARGPVRGGGAAAAAATASRRFKAAELDAIFASSGDDGAGAGAATPDPFGSGRAPFVNAEALGLEDACSQPIRAQQEELHRAARRVAAFMMRVLQTPDAGGAEQQQQQLGDSLGHSHDGGRGLLKKASTLGNSSACGSTGSSFHSAVLHLTGGTPTTAAAAAEAAPPSLALNLEQHRVLAEGFAFLYHSCRDQPDLLQGTALPILRVLRSHAPEFPYAMRLLAALVRTAGRATGLGVEDVEVLLTRCMSGDAEGGLSPEMQTEALGLVRAVLEAEGAASSSHDGAYFEGGGDHRFHRQYTVSSAPPRTPHGPDREHLALKAAVLEAVYRRLLVGDGGAGADAEASADFSLAAMALAETPRSGSVKVKHHHQQPGSSSTASSSSPMSWRLPNSGGSGGALAARDWAFKAEGLALVCACLETATQLERAQVIGEEELLDTMEGPSPVFAGVARGGSVGATEPPASLKFDALQGVKERVAALYPPEDCLAAAMDYHIPLPVRTLLLRLVKLQAFVATDRPHGAGSDEMSSSSSSRPSSVHGGAPPHPLRQRPAAATPPPPPLEEAKARLAAAAAALARTFELMQTFAGGCQLEMEAFRRSIRLGMVTLKEMEGMGVFPYLAKAIPAFVLAFLRRQGCGPDVQEALQLSLANAKRKLEKEQGRSRLWKATEGVLPQKVAKALLLDSSGEEVMAWIVDAFVHTHERKGGAAGFMGTQGSSSTDVSMAGGGSSGGGLLATLGRVASASSSAALHGGSGKQASTRSLLQQLHAQHPASAPAMNEQQEEQEPASIQVKVLAQMLGLIERLAGLVLHVPALQAQWAAAPDPVAQNLLVLLAFGAMAEKVYHMRGSPQQLAALAMGRAPSGVSDGAGPLRAFYRKGTLDGSTASRAESVAPGAQTTGILGATLNSLPGVGSGNSGATATAANSSSTATSNADSRFILYLTQALDARRTAARAAAEEEELLGRQLPVALDEARSYVLNVYEPPEVDDGNGSGCLPGPTCVPVGGSKGHAVQASATTTTITTIAPSPRSPTRPSGSSSIATTSGIRSLRMSGMRHGLHHHHRRQHVLPPSPEGGVRLIPYPPTTAPRDCALARVLWRQFLGFNEFFYEDAAGSALLEGEEAESLLGGTVDEATRLRRQRQHQQYQQLLHQLLQQPLMMQAGNGGAGSGDAGYVSLLDDEDFRAWSKSGGLFLEHILLMIRYRLWEEEDCCLFFLDIVTRFLDDGLARIRREGASRFDAQRLIKLVQSEVRATQRRQHALQALDAHTVLMALVAQAAQPSFGAAATAGSKAAHLLKVMPRVLRFGARLMATGNRQVQESIMDFHGRATVELLVQRKFCVGLRSLLRFCRYQVETLMYSSSSVLNNATGGGSSGGTTVASEAEAFDLLVAESKPALELITTLFDFLGALCAGHNMRARTFLREQRLSGDTVNLVAESASLLFTTCSYALTLMTYVQNRTFAAKVAPPVHVSQAKKTGRRFIAWHQSPRKFAHLADLLRVLGHGFACMTEMVQGPCHENQVICERLCTFAGEILEYCGTLHLELPSQWTHGRAWVGGDPLKFYELYIREMARVGAGNGSSEAASAAAHAAAAAAAPPPVAPPLVSVAAGGAVGSGGVPSLHLHHQQQEAEEREAALIVESLRQWRRVGERKMFSLHLQVTRALSALSSRGVAGGQKQQQAQHPQHGKARASVAVPLTSNDILGVDLGEFTAVCLHTEKTALKFLTAMLEGQSPGVVDHVRGSIDSWIMFQNMDSLVRSNGSSSGTSSGSDTSSSTAAANGAGPAQSTEQQRKAERQEAAVLYLTILSTLASLSGVQGGSGEYGVRMTKALEEWQEAFAKQGAGAGGNKHINMLVSSVEIVGADGQVQVVHFPVPDWIKTYWNYPLVQKAKDELAYQVNRASPEEKILDFNDRMVVLTKVMRRQELLHKIFSVFHGFVGGKSLGDSRFLPSPRAILLCLTLLLNMWLCMRLYYKDNAGESSPIWSTILSWDSTPSIIYAVKVAHLALCLSLLFTAALNSGAGDAVRGHRLRLLGARRAVSFDWFVSLVIVLNDVRWLLVMSVLSSVGLWATEVAYAFCVVDVIPQIRLMKFLLEALTRNSHKIWLTVLLCLVVLYVFSTISYLVFQNQYGFEDKYDCNSLATCFKLHVDYGIILPPTWRNSGAIKPDVHTTLVQSAQELGTFDFAMTILASLFNLSYVILVNLVLTAIVAGLIIDTFSQMRSENEAIEEDMQEKCFICSIDRDLIESAGISFRDHIRHQHNMWSYFWFRTYLYGKDPLSFTGPEHYCFQMFKDRRNLTRFFPLKKSLIIERKNIELKSKNEMDVLTGRVGSVEMQLAKLSMAVERLAEAQAGMNTKLAQEQHQLAGGVGEAVEAIKALQQQWTLQQQQQLQHAHATTATKTFLSKVTMAQRERQQQRGKQQDGGSSAASGGGGGTGSAATSVAGESPPRSTSPHWRAARTGLAKAAVAAGAGARVQEQTEEEKEGKK